MNKAEEMAKFGFTQSDYETSSMEDVAAAAREFERVLNSAKGFVHVDMTVQAQRVLGLEDRNHFSIRVTKIDNVYP
jgi:hypothetical protein